MEILLEVFRMNMIMGIILRRRSISSGTSLLCCDSPQCCGSGLLADANLADLIGRVVMFGMVLMKLDLRRESGRHAETLDAITEYLYMGRMKIRDLNS